MGSIKQNNRWIREFAFADKTLSDVAEIVEQVVEIILQMDLDTRCWISLDSYRFSCRTCVELQRLISPGRLNERIY